MKDVADGALAALSPLFSEMYNGLGRPSIPPEQLLKASLLTAFYSLRSERLFCEQFGLRPPVSLVSGDGHGGGILRQHLFEEPEAAA